MRTINYLCTFYAMQIPLVIKLLKTPHIFNYENSFSYFNEKLINKSTSVVKLLFNTAYQSSAIPYTNC